MMKIPTKNLNKNQKPFFLLREMEDKDLTQETKTHCHQYWERQVLPPSTQPSETWIYQQTSLKLVNCLHFLCKLLSLGMIIHSRRFCDLYKPSINFSTCLAFRLHEMSIQCCNFSCKCFPKLTYILSNVQFAFAEGTQKKF